MLRGKNEQIRIKRRTLIEQGNRTRSKQDTGQETQTQIHGLLRFLGGLICTLSKPDHNSASQTPQKQETPDFILS